MVKGACDALNVDYAISKLQVYGPSGATLGIPVGTRATFGTKDMSRLLNPKKILAEILILLLRTTKHTTFRTTAISGISPRMKSK